MSAVLQANERGRPSWLEAWVKRCYELVPEFRDRGPPPECFEDIPTVDRGDLGRDIARFVPDDVPWAHLDIAGPAFNEEGPYDYVPAGGTGVAVRTLVALAQSLQS